MCPLCGTINNFCAIKIGIPEDIFLPCYKKLQGICGIFIENPMESHVKLIHTTICISL